MTPTDWHGYVNSEGHLLQQSGYNSERLSGSALLAELPFLETLLPFFFIDDSEETYLDLWLPAVQLDGAVFKGYFDIVLVKVWYGQREAVFCHADDRTAYYQKVQLTQQEFNEGKLEMELKRMEIEGNPWPIVDRKL